MKHLKKNFLDTYLVSYELIVSVLKTIGSLNWAQLFTHVQFNSSPSINQKTIFKENCVYCICKKIQQKIKNLGFLKNCSKIIRK